MKFDLEFVLSIFFCFVGPRVVLSVSASCFLAFLVDVSDVKVDNG